MNKIIKRYFGLKGVDTDNEAILKNLCKNFSSHTEDFKSFLEMVDEYGDYMGIGFWILDKAILNETPTEDYLSNLIPTLGYDKTVKFLSEVVEFIEKNNLDLGVNYAWDVRSYIKCLQDVVASIGEANRKGILDL